LADPTTRILRPARIVALALIGLAVLGLAYLRFASDGDSVSVPAGGKAGDLTLERCNYATEDGSYEADCGTLVVPENRHDPDSRLIALPVKRIRVQSANPGAPIFYFHGGPGGTTMNFPAASRFADDRDVVLVGYRGVDGSVRLDCPEVVSARERSRDWLSTASLETEAAAFRACADRLARRGRPGGVHAAAAGRRHRVRSAQARLRPDRARQRELRHARRHDLRLALPGEHPPLGAGRRQPARPLPLVLGSPCGPRPGL
jgi:hypothetical protein